MKLKLNKMYKLTHKKTGFKQYMNTKQASNFLYKNGTKKYTIKEIKTFDVKNFFSFIAFLLIMCSFVIAFIYYATN